MTLNRLGIDLTLNIKLDESSGPLIAAALAPFILASENRIMSAIGTKLDAIDAAVKAKADEVAAGFAAVQAKLDENPTAEELARLDAVPAAVAAIPASPVAPEPTDPNA